MGQLTAGEKVKGKNASVGVEENTFSQRGNRGLILGRGKEIPKGLSPKHQIRGGTGGGCVIKASGRKKERGGKITRDRGAYHPERTIVHCLFQGKMELNAKGERRPES